MALENRGTFAEIDLEAFRHNYRLIEEKVAPAKVAAAVKADAYGHGLEVIAKELETLGASFLCTAYAFEAVELREAGIKIPVLVMVRPLENEIEEAVKLNIELTVDNIDTGRQISDVCKRAGVEGVIHINIDTGMHRPGFDPYNDIEKIIELSELDNIRIKGMFTHFATADWDELDFTYEQLKKLDHVVEKLPFRVPVVHAANSAASLRAPKTYLNTVRPGLSLYGYYPSEFCRQSPDLKSVMSLKSYVSDIKEYSAGESFGYSRTHTAEEDTKIAYIPAGYADGVNRLFSNNGSVLINGSRYPIVGRVDMDAIMVDTGPDDNISRGDEVVLFGK
ncbi:MAG: alanine racemase, partial [bacterium]|nr:alanine racemase [bacterium]